MHEKEIKGALKGNRLIVGSREVLKNLRRGKVEAVFITSNCPKHLESRARYYSRLSEVKIVEFGGNSMQLGEVCGRPYKTLMAGIAR